MRDDAVSPVVAFMLLLMIVVSFISVLNAYYIPSLKQQAEIEHLQNVEQSFQKISSDILHILTFRQKMSLKEPVQLGGGGVEFSPIKSSGYLEINTTLQDEPLSEMTISVDGNHISDLDSKINRTKILFRPVGNFWINQGYEWEDGIINITKGSNKTYLQYIDDGKASNERTFYYDMFNPRVNLVTDQDKKNIISIKIDLVNIENPEGNRSFSSNGAGTVWIELKESDKISNININDRLIFDFLGSDVLRQKTVINEYFATYENHDITKNVFWYGENHTLTKNIEPVPIVSITRWNLSIHV